MKLPNTWPLRSIGNWEERKEGRKEGGREEGRKEGRRKEVKGTKDRKAKKEKEDMSKGQMKGKDQDQERKTQLDQKYKLDWQRPLKQWYVPGNLRGTYMETIDSLRMFKIHTGKKKKKKKKKGRAKR